MLANVVSETDAVVGFGERGLPAWSRRAGLFGD